jgi:uncharacterized iron-regulated protein
MRLAVTAAFLLLGLATASCSGSQVALVACGQPGQWVAPSDAQAAPVTSRALLERLARQPVVLLGEAHDSAEDHRWQAHLLAQLHVLKPQLAVGFEMFPRRIQPVLDLWVAGGLTEAEFLQRSEWDKVWGFDARDYLPLFHFARMHRIPMLALNVERSLIEAIGKQGWEAVPESQREGVSKPAAPAEAYRKVLRAVFEHHPAKTRAKGEEPGGGGFARFVDSQTAWDRAMAQVIAQHLQRHPDRLVVGIMGAGHARYGHGVAHQLKDLGIAPTGVLLTWPRSEDCSELGETFADGLFLVDPPKRNPPRLGVGTEVHEQGLRITEVTPGSVAEAAGLQRGDVIVEVGGQPAKSILTLRSVVQRQPAGTWLPLKIKRADSELELVARFPLGS